MKTLLCITLLCVTAPAQAMTCANWRAVAEYYADARDRGVPEEKLIKIVTSETKAGRMPREQLENNLGVITGIYHAPSLKDAAPETVGHIAEITCHQSHWESE